jgi:O-antigen/teichoic acid export membrane protein
LPASQAPSILSYSERHFAVLAVGTAFVLFQPGTLRAAGTQIFRLTALLSFWRQCLPFSAMSLAAIASVDLDKSLVAKNSTPEIAGAYLLGYRLAMIFSMPIGALSQALIPQLVRKTVLPGWIGVRKTTAAAVAVTFLYSMAIIFIAFTVHGRFFALFGNGYSALTAVVPGFCALLVLYNLKLIAGTLLYVANRPWTRAGLEAVAILLMVVCNTTLVPRLGLEGAVISAIASEFWIFCSSWLLVGSILRRAGRTEAIAN